MQYVVAGLGNPGEEYEYTRHNVGRSVVERLALSLGASDWRDDAKLRARVSEAHLPSGDKVIFVLPNNYMNRSGGAVAPLVPTKQKVENLIVVHDDIDLGTGTLRIVYNRGAGGHRGVKSIVRAIKTQAFSRVRVGVVPLSPSGALKKPKGEEAVSKLILKQLTKRDRERLEPVIMRAVEATATLLLEGREVAMRKYNGVPIPPHA